jgi:hypothetical protein
MKRLQAMKQLQAFYKLPLVLLSAVALTVLKDKSAFAFSVDVLKGPFGRQEPATVDYTWNGSGGNGTGVVTRKNYAPLGVPPASDNILNYLNAEYRKRPSGALQYTFEPAKTELSGRFAIKDYWACAPVADRTCGTGFIGTLDTTKTVGTNFSVYYEPGSGDPAGNQSYFIQLVSKIVKQPGSDQVISDSFFLDNLTPKNVSDGLIPISIAPPYPGQREELPSRYLEDTPQDRNVTLDHDWSAVTYLATERPSEDNSGKIVSLYNGVAWGWKSTFNPSRADGGGNPGGNPGGGYGGGYGAALQPLSIDGFAFAPDLQVNASSAAAPEPTTVVGSLVAIGTWAGVSWRKRKKLKP